MNEELFRQYKELNAISEANSIARQRIFTNISEKVLNLIEQYGGKIDTWDGDSLDYIWFEIGTQEINAEIFSKIQEIYADHAKITVMAIAGINRLRITIQLMEY